MVFTEKQLAQVRASSASPTNVYLPSGVLGIVKTITLCNSSTSDTFVSVYKDGVGGASTTNSAIVSGMSVLAGQTIILSGYWIVASGGNVKYAPQDANTVTITLDGAEVS